MSDRHVHALQSEASHALRTPGQIATARSSISRSSKDVGCQRYDRGGWRPSRSHLACGRQVSGGDHRLIGCALRHLGFPEHPKHPSPLLIPTPPERTR